MAAATTSRATLNSTQRAWLKKMGAALDAPLADIANVDAVQVARTGQQGLAPASEKLGVEPLGLALEWGPKILELLKTLGARRVCVVKVVNKTDRVLHRGKEKFKSGGFSKIPPDDTIKPDGQTEFVAASPENNPFGEVEGEMPWMLDLDTNWHIRFANPRAGSVKGSTDVTGVNAAKFSPDMVKGNGDVAEFRFTLFGGGGGQTPPGPKPTPGAVEAASSCHVTITNDTKLTLTLGNQGHERGDFMTFPAKTLAPGASTTFVSVETPNNKDPKDEGCKGFLLWQVGSPQVLWRVEWDNPEQQKNTATADFNPRNSGFLSLNQIGQGEENVPVSFTISGDGGVTPPPPGAGGKIEFTVIDAEADTTLDGATVSAAGKSEKSANGGKAVLELPPGTQAYVVTAANFEDNKGTVEVTSGKDGEKIVFMKKGKPASGTTVKFTVTDKESGEKLSGANVKVGTKTSPTDNDGVCTLEVEPGSQNFLVQKEGFQDATGKVDAKPNTQTDQAVQLEKEPSFNPPPESKQPTLRKGDKSADGWVEYLQKLLNKFLGKGTVPEDGNFDQKTYDAVKKFQGSTNPPCQVDGIVGNETWSMLRKGTREAVGVNEQDDEKGAEGRWATEKNDFVTYDAGSDELRMVAFSVGDAPIDKFKATFKITSQDKKVTKTFEVPIGAPTGPSPTGSGHMHVVVVPQMSVIYGNGEHDVDTYLEEELGGDRWTGKVKVTGTGPSTKTGDIGFTVTDEKSGKPVAGATVTLAGQAKPTDAAGIALYSKFAAGKHKFTVSHKDFETASGEAEVLADASTPKSVKLKPKAPTKTGDIGFTVTTDDKNGTPISVSGATVTLAGQAKQTDAAGIALYSKFAAGKHKFTVTHKDFETVSGEAEVLADASTPKNVKLKPKSPGAKSGDIGFTVTDEKSGAPVSGATVTMAGVSKPTDGSGIALFANAPAGKHKFNVSHKDFEPASGEAVVVADSSTPKSVKLKPKAATKTGDIGFTVTNEITGAVVSGATVTMAGVSKTTDGSGIALFASAPAGKHKFTVSHKDFEPASGEAEVVANSSTPKSVKLKAKPGTIGNITFRVIDETTGDAVNGASVTLAGKTKRTDRAGTVLFEDAPAGKQSFTVSHGSFEPFTGQAEVLADSSTGKEVKLKAKPKTGDIAIRVSDATGAAISGASVTIAGTTKSTERAGTALFENAPAGKQSVNVSHKDFEPFSGQADVLPDSSTAKEVKLKRK